MTERTPPRPLLARELRKWLMGQNRYWRQQQFLLTDPMSQAEIRGHIRQNNAMREELRVLVRESAVPRG